MWEEEKVTLQFLSGNVESFSQVHLLVWHWTGMFGGLRSCHDCCEG